MTRGSYHVAGNWIIFVPLIGDVHELIEFVPNASLAGIWVRQRNRFLMDLR